MSPRDDFGRRVVYSLGLHSFLLIAAFVVPNLARGPKLDAPATQTIDVMWAETVTGPDLTRDNKLPGPTIQPPPEAAPAPEEPRVTTEKKPAAPALTPEQKKKLDADERRKKMKDALAGLEPAEEARPAPDLNNFPSVQDSKKRGLPGSPFGGGSGKLAGDPDFARYKHTITRTISKNLVWIRPETGIRAEIRFRLGPDGAILGPEVFKSSGNGAFDQASLRAVLKSSPLPPPPEKLTQQIVQEYFIVVVDPREK